MRFDKFTNQLQTALSDAQSLAIGRDNNQIDPAHLLLALVGQESGWIRPLLSQAGVNVAQLRQALAAKLDSLATVSSPTGEVQMSQELVRLLNLADRLSQKKGDKFISSELVLLAALDENGELVKLLQSSGADRKLLEQAIERVRGGQAVDDPEEEGSRGGA